MKKRIKNFIKNNPLKFENNFSKRKVLLVDRIREDKFFIASLAGSVCNKFLKLDIDLVTDLSKYGENYKLYKSYNFRKIYHLSLKMIDLNKIKIIFISTFNFFYTLSKIIILGDDWFINKYKFKNIYFGDIFYDTFVRHNKGYIKNSLLHINFLKVLFIGLYKINHINEILDQENYHLIITNTDVYTSTSAITMRLSLKNKIKVILFRNNYFQLYTKLSDAYSSNKKLYKKDLYFIDKIDKKWKSKINIYLSNKFRGKSKQRDSKVAFRNNKKSLVSVLKNKNIKLSNFKRIGLFAPHCFTDSNYGQGHFIFKNYYEHFLKTLQIIEKNKNIFWFVKPHPLNSLYNEENLTNKALIKLNKQNIYIHANELNTFDLLKLADIIVTGRGTIGVEAACLGKKPVLAGDSYYSSLGITANPKDINEYEKFIQNENSKYTLNKDKINYAKKACFYENFRHSFYKSKIAPMTEFTDIDVNKKIVIQNFTYRNNYLDIINLKLKKYDIFSDYFYLSIKNFILKI